MSSDTTVRQPYIQRLASNLKGEVDTELSNCTLLVGKSGTGKSAIIDAVSLALRGEARSPKLGKKPASLIGLAPVGAEELYANVTLSTGEVCQWSSKGTPQTTEHRIAGGDGSLEVPAGVFVSDTASTLMLGDPKKLQQAMLAATPTEVAMHKVLKQTPEVLHELLRTCLVEGAKFKQWPKPPEPAEGESRKSVADMAPYVVMPPDISAALTYIAEKKRETNKRLKVLEGLDVDEEAIPLSEDELAELNRLAELDTKLRLESSDPEQLQSLADEAYDKDQQLQSRMRELSPMGTEGIAKLQNTHDTLKMIATTQKFLLDRLNAAAAKLGHDKVQSFTCPICSTPEVEAINLQERFKLVESKLKVATESFEDQVQRRKQWDELKAECQALRDEQARLDKKIAKARKHESVEDEEGLRERLAELRSRKQKARQELANRAELPELKKYVDNLNAIKDILQKHLGSIVEGATAVVEKRLNRFLPKTFRAKIGVQGTKKDSVFIEVSIHGGLHRDYRFLSGAQKATLIAAVAAAMIPPEAPPVRILAMDEVVMDSTTLRNLMAATARSVAKGDGFNQAIFCTVSWTGQAPKGWSMIQITRPKGQEVAELAQA